VARLVKPSEYGGIFMANIFTVEEFAAIIGWSFGRGPAEDFRRLFPDAFQMITWAEAMTEIDKAMFGSSGPIFPVFGPTGDEMIGGELIWDG
jgi:hypothetical protein